MHTTFGTEHSRGWTCKLFSEVQSQGLGSVHYFRQQKLKAGFSVSAVVLAMRHLFDCKAVVVHAMRHFSKL